MKDILKSNFIMKLIESVLGKGSFVIFTLLFSLACTRLYGAEIFGKFTFAFSLVSIIMYIAKAGLDNGLMYSIPKNKYTYVSLSFLVNFIVSLILLIIAWIIIDDTFIKFMIPLIWLYSSEHLFFGIYRAEGKIKEYYLINGLLTMILRVSMIVLLYYLLGKNEYSIAIGVYISFIFSNIMYFIKHRGKFGKVKFDKTYLTYSFTLVLAALMGVVINKIDIVMLGMMTANQEVGIYQITIQLSNVAAILLIVFNTVFAPRISNMFHESKYEELKNLYVKATRILSLLSIIVTSILILGSSFFLNLFGEVFAQGQMSLILRTVGQFVNIAVGGVWFMLSMTGRPKFQMYANIVAFTMNIILNFVLIPKYGMNGAAFASMVTIIFMNIVGYIVVSRQFNVKVFKYI
jgi:O-antigen/teichoic acid export membrane protein